MLHRSMKVHLERGDREGAKDERKLRNSRIFYSAVFYLTCSRSSGTSRPQDIPYASSYGMPLP
jgi:hypothetical protein